MYRVLFVNHSTVIGGAETNLLNILRFGTDAGFRPVGVLLPGNGPLADAVAGLGYPVGIISYHGLLAANPFRAVQTVQQLVGWIQQSKADVIHLNHQWLIGWVAMAARLCRRPIVCHIRNYLDGDFYSREQWWLARVDKLLAVSEATRARAVRLGVPPNRVLTLYDGIDMDRFADPHDQSGARTALGLQPLTTTIGFCGRLVPEKGPEDLLEAFSNMVRKRPNLQLVVAGADQEQGHFLAQLGQRAHHLQIQDMVKFVGFHTEIQHVMAALDVLVIPSRLAMPEGLPLAVVEGLAAGCVVVATPNGGIPEAVIEGKTGFLAEPENPSALAQVILRALALMPAERESMQANGRDLVKTSFSIQRQVSNLAKLYMELA